MVTRRHPDVALRLSVLEGRLAVCKLEPENEVPNWAVEGDFFSITRTRDELSIVCPEQNVPEGSLFEGGWRALGIEGPLDFSLSGVLISVAEPLAAADVSIFAVSTYDTDYVLVREDKLENVISTLRRAGHEVQGTSVVVRPATRDDESFLRKMLYEAVHWSAEESGPKPSLEELISEPGLHRYLEGWGKENDLAVIALDTSNGSRIGAAWYRTFSVSDPGYGFVDEATPEIVLAVAPDRRGVGVGGTLLHTLMDAAHSNGFGTISLGVQKSNHAAIKLYEQSGFTRLKEDGRAWIMKADLTTGTATNDAQ